MNYGDRIVLTECVVVIGGHDHDRLDAGTVGTVLGSDGPLLRIQTAKGIYDDIPAASVKLLEGGKAA